MHGLGFFLLKILILTLTRHTVWNPGLCPLFPGEHPTAKQRMLFCLLLGARRLGLLQENMTLIMALRHLARKTFAT